MGIDPDFWRDRPVLVTGATGLLGAWLTRQLIEAGARVTCLVRDRTNGEPALGHLLDSVRVVPGNICDGALVARVVAESGVDTVMHLAAQAVVGIANRNPVSTFETNIQGTWNILEACRQSAAVRAIVVASSDKAYGEHRKLPYREDAPLEGRHPYDVSKSCADLIAHAYAKSFGLPVAITRCGNFYGGGDLNWNRIVPSAIRAVVQGERPVIRSDGQYVRDYFYVEDGAAAHLLLAQEVHRRPELRGAAFNFSNELQVTVLQLVERILKAMGSSLEPDIRNEVSNEIRCQYLSADKARRELNWHPLFTLDEGLDRTIAWYREYLA